jgi:hypothetical protein
MAIAPPPRPPSQNESDALVREARARQRQRRLLIASLIALIAGAAIALYATLATTGRPPAASDGPRSAASPSSPRCGIRVVGTRILDHSGATTYRDPAKVAMTHQIRCSGSTAWVVFVNGVGMMHEDYVGVRSGDGGRTWRMVFAETPGVRPLHGIDAEVGAWRLDGRRSAYFLGSCPACGGTGTASLSVTTDGGRTFHRYQVPGINDAYRRTSIHVSGNRVTIRAIRVANGKPATPKTVTLTVR